MKGKVRQAIEQALEDKGLVAHPFTAPAAINGKPVRVVGVRENILKIQMYDPIEFLGKVMAGEAIPSVYVNEDGSTSQTFEFAPLKERIAIAKFMASKIMPTMHVVNDMRNNDDPGKTGFDALVDEAINRGRQTLNGTKALGPKPS